MKTKTIEINDLHKKEKELIKRKQNLHLKLEKRKVYLEQLKTRALEKTHEAIKLQYKKKIEKFERPVYQEMRKLEKQLERIKKGKEPKEVKKSKQKPKLRAKALAIFGKFIRLSKTNSNGFARCISSGVIRNWKAFDAGHYFPKGQYPSIMFDERNVRPQSKNENRKQSGSIGRYKDEIVERIGQEEFNDLVNKSKELKQWKDWELQEIIDKYIPIVEELLKTKG